MKALIWSSICICGVDKISVPSPLQTRDTRLSSPKSMCLKSCAIDSRQAFATSTCFPKGSPRKSSDRRMRKKEICIKPLASQRKQAIARSNWPESVWPKTRTLVAEFRSPPKKVHTFSSRGDSRIPKSVRCTHSATKGPSSTPSRGKPQAPPRHRPARSPEIS